MVGLTVLLLGCPGPGPCKAPVAVWGDAQKAPTLAILTRSLDGTYSELTADATPIDLTFPIQGGHVLFVGARIQNLGACGDTLTANLRNPTSGEILAVESRSVDFTVAADGGGTADLSDTSNVANVPACPDASARDVLDTDWVLEVTVVDKQKRTATATRPVRPACRQSDPFARELCACECRADYFFGKCGRNDAGSADGG